MHSLVGKGLQHPSGRVIALGRLMLATLFLIAIWVDSSQPARAPEATYALLAAYLAFAAAIVVITWNNWWLDAKLAGPAHAVDIILFTLLVLLTEGFTSPYFHLLHVRASFRRDPLGLASDGFDRDPPHPALSDRRTARRRRRRPRSSCTALSSGPAIS